MSNNNVTVKLNKFEENKAEFGNIYLSKNNLLKFE